MKVQNLATLVLAGALTGCSSLPLVGNVANELASRTYFGDNVHKLSNRAWRSGQLDGKKELKNFLRENKIDVYYTLRGPNEVSRWEKEVCDSLGVRYEVFSFSARFRPRDEMFNRFVNFMIEMRDSDLNYAGHCFHGTERIGMAQTVKEVLEGVPVRRALAHSFSLRKHHYLGWGKYDTLPKFMKRKGASIVKRVDHHCQKQTARK